MDKRIYFLMIVSFVIGMVELLISGILDLMAADLNVTLGQAGYLITIFSLIFAVASPILLLMTAKVERKKLVLISLVIFLLGNILTVFSPNYLTVFLSRIITALSGAILIILCLVMAPAMVEPKYRGRAIGVVSMGVSASLVLGVPLGLVLGNAFGWRAPFVMISILTVFAIIGVAFLMDKVQPKPGVPLREQLQALRSPKISLALATTFLYMTGHSVLYSYLKPFIQEATGLEGTWISLMYFLFGAAAVSGGGVGGTLADLYGTRKTIMVSLVSFTAILLAIPFSGNLLILFLAAIIIWGMLSWAISPAMQSYLIESDPKTSDIQQSLNNSALHFGIAAGSLIGGIVIEQYTTTANALIGGVIVMLSVVTAAVSMRMSGPGSSGQSLQKESIQ